MRRAGRLSASLVVGVVAMAGCSVSNLSFQQDDRVRILSPHTGDRVELPLTVRWSAEEIDGSFLVLFDRAPMRPGQSLMALVSDTDPCRRENSCLDREEQESRRAIVTDERSLVVDQLPDRRATNRSKDTHEMVIVLLDDQGRRQGESAFVREFIVERDDS